ncbi:MAG: amidohydrolase family protein [Deltaproteobacteria bacterium]|nr:amidohydrolase family protein [Deltaproteobacteria bacterium]
MIIDIFSHHVGSRFTKRYEEYGRKWPMPPENADPEVRLGLMDKYGIDMHALVQTTPVLLGFDPEKAAELCRASNDDNYALCKAYPDRFVNICMISLLDMKSAMEELDRGMNELDCRAVTICTNQAGKGLDSEEYFPFYEKVEELDLPILLHPLDWESYPLVDMEKGWRMMHVFGWPFDTTQAVWRLIFSGVLDRFPSLKIVMHHLGAMLPFFARRIEINIRMRRMGLGQQLNKDLSEYWVNIYGDTAVDGTKAAYPCGYAFFGPYRMMYGTDYPAGPERGEDFMRENLIGVKALDIPAEEMDMILGGNARRLLKIA